MNEIELAIKTLEDINTDLESHISGNTYGILSSTLDFDNAIDLAIQALQEKAEREKNKPLQTQNKKTICGVNSLSCCECQPCCGSRK